MTLRPWAGPAALLLLATGCSAPPPGDGAPPETGDEPRDETGTPPAPGEAGPGPEAPPPEDLPSGVLMFRGSPRRDRQGVGALPRDAVRVVWRHGVGCGGDWCGVGWTGQPLLVDWGARARAVQEFTAPGGPAVEVIVAAMDGRVHFLDLATGEPSRPRLRAQGGPIKGTASVDPRGPPLLYVGQGIPGPDGFHYRVFSLINRAVLLDIDGRRIRYGDADLAPARSWGAFDGNAAVLPDADQMWLGGENGLLYRVDLGTLWDGQRVGLHPDVRPTTYHTVRPRYGDAAVRDGSGRWAAGIESSVAIYDGVVYWTDSIGSLMGRRMDTGEDVLALDLGDDTDASPVITVEDGRPFLYVGSEVDLQVPYRPATRAGTLRFHKVDLADGALEWTLELPAWTCKKADKKHDFNGGILATAAPGSGPSADLVFVSTAHEPAINGGRLLAVRRDAGDDGAPVIAWAGELHGPGWSSPATDGRTVVAPDSAGWISAFDAVTGDRLWEIQLEGAVESSPVFWDGRIVVGVRGGAIVALDGAAAPSAPPAE